VSDVRGGLTGDMFLGALMKRAVVERRDIIPVWFEEKVLEKYREGPYQVVRTNSAGRLKLEGVFSLDFGIPGEGGVIHASLEAVARLPEKERSHFLDHLIVLPLSVPFLQMQFAPGSCFDDGDSRPYFGGE